jgi:hypothetical protein
MKTASIVFVIASLTVMSTASCTTEGSAILDETLEILSRGLDEVSQHRYEVEIVNFTGANLYIHLDKVILLYPGQATTIVTSRDYIVISHQEYQEEIFLPPLAVVYVYSVERGELKRYYNE